MKIFIINKYGQTKIKDTDILPRIGDNVDMFYMPHPTVKHVLLWPIEGSLNITDKDIDAIVTVE